MKPGKLLRNSFSSLKKNKTRSLLTALGIIIGVASVIVMVGIGKGAQQQIETEIARMGTNMLIVFPGSSSRGGVRFGAGSANRFTLDDVEKIAEESKYIEAISPVVFAGAQVIGGGNNWNTSINGVGTDYLKIRSWDLASGDFFDEKDVRFRRKVAVVGKTVVNELFGEDANPIGERIRINNQPFVIIGILKEKGQDAHGRDQDDVILAPATTVLYRLRGGRYINIINVSAKSAQYIDSAKAEMTAIMRKQHRLSYGEEDDFTIRTQTEITEMASQTSKTMTLLLAAIAAVSLIVGGIGIMNIMLVSVTERTREIGIRMALGAREKDILLQFLTEAIVLSLIGGLIGIIVSFALIFGIDKFTTLPAIVNPPIIFLSLCFACMVGIFFGYYPAHKASKLNPIDALRYE